MYPTLSDMIKDIFGIYIPLPIQTYGLMMALAFVFAGWIGMVEMKRKEREGFFHPIYVKKEKGKPASWSELLLNFLIWGFVFMKLFGAFQNYDEFTNNPEHFVLSLEGNLIAGIIFGLGAAGYVWWKKNKEKLPKPKIVYEKVAPHQLLLNILVIAGIWGIIGAKVFDALSNYKSYRTFELFTNFSEAWPIFKASFFSFSGLAFLGGLIFGAVAVSMYIKKYNLNFWHMTDVAALAIPLAYAIGRLGCQLSGDGCWGIPNLEPKPHWLSFLPDWMWAFDYPHNILGQGAADPQWGIQVEHIAGCQGPHCFKLATPVFPTPFYETTIMLIVFFILFALRKKIKYPGILFSLYLIFAGLERFFIEFIRHNFRYHIFGLELTQAQLISIFMIIIGIGAIIFILTNKEKIIKWSTPTLKEINFNPQEKKAQKT